MPNTKFIATFLVAAGLFLAAHASAQDAPAANSSTTSTAAAKPAPAAKPGQTTGTKSATSTAAKPKTAAPAPVALTTQKQKVSYAIGLNIGKNLKRDSVEIDTAVFLRGLKDALADAKPALSDDDAKATLTQLQAELRAKEEEKAKVAALENKMKGDAFLAANKSNEGVVTLPSGLQYKIVTQGTGPKPSADDVVNCNYRGTLIDGTEFDSTAKHGGKPLSIPVGQVIKGWTEALQLMPVGSKWQLYIPSNLAYGERGAPGSPIGPNSALIFDVELISIEPKKAAETPKPGTEAPAEAQGTAKPAAQTQQAQPANKPKDPAPATPPPPKS